MKKAFVLFRGDRYLSTVSFVIMGVFTSEEGLKDGVTKLINQYAKENFKTHDHDADYKIEEFVEDQIFDFELSKQTWAGNVRFIAKEVEIDTLGEFL